MRTVRATPGAVRIRIHAPAGTLRTTVAMLVLVGACGSVAAQGLQFYPKPVTDGSLHWRTLTTEHFRFHFPTGYEPFAVQLGGLAERVHERLERKYASGVERTDVLLDFSTDLVNGFANPTFGLDQMVLYLRNLSVGEDFRQFRTSLDLFFTHEYTHIVTLRPYRRPLPFLLRLFTGAPPNVFSPWGFIEGTAVYEESLRGGGRVNDVITRMMYRTAIEADAFPDPAELLNGSHRWPGGTIYYRYGGRFVRFIAERYGDAAIVRFWQTDVPLPLDLRLWLADLPPMHQLYEEFRRAELARFRKEIALIRRRPETRLTRLTTDGRNKAHLTLDGKGRPIFFAAPPNRRPGIYRYEPGAAPVLTRRTSASGGLDFTAGPRVASEAYALYPTWGFRFELMDARRSWFDRRLNPGVSSRSPSVSPDGRFVYFVEQKRRGRSLVEARFARDGSLTDRKRLLFSPTGRLQFTALSSDGLRLATMMQDGPKGPLSLFVCERTRSEDNFEGGRCRSRVAGRGAKLHPRFSPDGSRLYFSSNATGVYNLYAYSLSEESTRQLTNVTGGLFYPVVQGDQLLAIGYFRDGFDLVAIQSDQLLGRPVEFFQALPEGSGTKDAQQKEPTGPEGPAPRRPGPGTPNDKEPELPAGWTLGDYSPIARLGFFVSGLVNPGLYPGGDWNVGAGVRDPLDRHNFWTGVSYEPRLDQVFPYAQYDYTRFVTGFGLSYVSNFPSRKERGTLCNADFKRASTFVNIACLETRPYFEQSRGALRRTFTGRVVSGLVGLGFVSNKLRNAHLLTDIFYAGQDFNLSGPTLQVLVGDTTVYPESVSPEHGWRIIAGAEYYWQRDSRAFDTRDGEGERGLDYAVVEGGLALYLPSFFDHHVNYLSGYGYTSVGRDRDFQAVTLGRFVRGIEQLRSPADRSAVVFTYEYRFPLVWFSRQIYRRWSRVMLRQIGAALLFDYGAPFDRDRISRQRWVRSYGVSLQLGLQLFHLPLPFQFEYSVSRAQADFGEVQHRFAFRAGGPADRLQSATGSLVQSDAAALAARELPLRRRGTGYFREPTAGGFLR